jgi:uncharacterized protein
VRKGAFAHALHTDIPLLWQHDTSKVIGKIESLAEDARGLRVIARLSDGQSVRTGQGLSFGYRVLSADKRNYRELTALDLMEVSVVTHPMQPLARVIAVA